MAALDLISSQALASISLSSASQPRCTRAVSVKCGASLGSELSGVRLATAPVARHVGARAGTGRTLVPATCQVAVGDEFPSFSLLDQEGRAFSLSKIKGKNAVVYFYPADDTPGCTKQACSFRDSYELFRDLGAEVVGISGDSPESHAKFAEKYDLPFRLLSDEGNELRKELGIPGDLFGFLPGRQTYVIDKKGVVQLVFNSQFKAEKHVEETVSILEELKDMPEEKGGFPLPDFKLPDFKIPEFKIPKF